MTASTEQRSVAGEWQALLGAPTARVAVVGVSTSHTCGVRDHATLLAACLQEENVRCSLHWLYRSQPTLWGARSEIASWAQALVDELSSDAPDAVLLHYSVFSYSHRGLPVFVAPVVSALRESRIPLISFLHEFAYRQRGRPGLNGRVWALSQRAALFGVMRASAAAVVTVQERVDWLASRAWLPKRPLAFAPVFSTLPPPVAGPSGEHERPLIGLFGYTCTQEVALLVLDAVALLWKRGLPVTMMLLGAPGPHSDAGEMWTKAARSRGVEEALGFSGTVPAQELSDMLARCDLLLFADRPGPTSRKTTLAASLASGTAVVTTDGPGTWKQLVEAGASELAQPQPNTLAAAIERLLRDDGLREAIGARGRAFAEQSMGVTLSGAVVAGLLRDILRGRSTKGSRDDRDTLDADGAQAREGSSAVAELTHDAGAQAREGSSAVAELTSEGERSGRVDSHSARVTS